MDSRDSNFGDQLTILFTVEIEKNGRKGEKVDAKEITKLGNKVYLRVVS